MDREVEWLCLLGWCGVLAAFVSGAVIGFCARNESWLGGYTQRSRRLVRLGHISLAALGMLTVLACICVAEGFSFMRIESCRLMALGLATMPLACFGTAYDERLRYLFPVPVVSLVAAAGWSCVAWL